MYRSRNVKCSNCKDIFRAEYDSRKESERYATCKCGEVRGYLNSNGSFICGINNPCEALNYKEQEHIIEYYEEDYIQLSDEESEMLSEIIEECNNITNSKIGVMFYNYTDERYVDLRLEGISEYMECVSIKAYVRLIDDDGFGWKYGKSKQENRLFESLTRFKNVVSMVKNGELDLTRPKSVFDNEDLEWNDHTRTRLELYDYKLYC